MSSNDESQATCEDGFGGATRPWTREVTIEDLLAVLRVALGRHPMVALPGEQAMTSIAPQEGLISRLDGGGWIAWCRLGAWLLSGEAASLSHVGRMSRGLAAALAMTRTNGNVSRASKSLGASRRTLRESLRAVGLHPWPGFSHDHEAAEGMTSASCGESPMDDLSPRRGADGLVTLATSRGQPSQGG